MRTLMQLYGSYTSPYVRHCRVVLAEVGLPFELVETVTTQPEFASPTKRVPYLEDGEVRLSDSSSIVKYLRERCGQTFVTDLGNYEFYCLVRTFLDAAINVFLFERTDSLLPTQSAYLTRQVSRVENGLTELNQRKLPQRIEGDDAAILLGCFLGWGRYRNRFSLEGHANLCDFIERCEAYEPFAKTAPPL